MTSSDYGEPEFLCFEVVRSVHDVANRDLPKTEFNKQCYLVYKELQEEGLETGLPVYWYEHGIMVDLDELLNDFIAFKDKRWDSGRRGKNAVIVDDWEADQFDIEQSIADRISLKASEVARRFEHTFDTSVVKDRTYKKYGNSFVQALNEARYYIEDLNDIDRINQEDYVADVGVSYSDFVDDTDTNTVELPEDVEGIESDVIEFLDRLVETYPTDTYDKMEPQFRQWESISRQFAMNHMFSQLGNFTNEFWIRFSRGELRIEHNENISPLKVRRWRMKRDDEIEALEEEIRKYRKVLLENREPTAELSAVGDSFSQSVRDTYLEFREGDR